MNPLHWQSAPGRSSSPSSSSLLVYLQGFQSRRDLTGELRGYCDSSYMTRVAVADATDATNRAMGAHNTYLGKVLEAISVKGDVKDAATISKAAFSDALPVLANASRVLADSASVRCADVFKSPSLIP